MFLTKVLSRRVSIVVDISIFFSSLLFISLFPSEKTPFSMLLVAVISLLLSFRVYGLKRLFLNIMTPLIYVLSTFFVFILFPQISLVFKLILSFAFASFYYYLLLAINAIVVASLENKVFPLVRAGKTLAYITTVFASFLSITLIYKFYGSFVLFPLMILAISFLLSLQYLWTQFQKIHLTESFIIALLSAQASLVIGLFSTEAFFKALFVSVLYFSLLGIVESSILHKLNKSIYVQYLVMLLMVFLFILVY